MRALIVGAGAVGQVFGHHLQRGGAAVSLFVRPSHVAEVSGELALTRVRRRRTTATWRADEVLTHMDEVAARAFDVVVLCVSSPALRQGTWLRDLGAAIGSAYVVGITPGAHDAELVGRCTDPARVIWGAFAVIAYDQAAVEGRDGGLAMWRPPGAVLPFSGPPEATRSFAATLRRGGLPTRITRDVVRDLAFEGPLLDLLVLGLEGAGWEFRRLAGDRPRLRVVRRAMTEAWAIAARRFDTRTPFGLRLLGPRSFALALRLAPRVVPFPIETYFRVHFTKVAEQTRAQLDALVGLAEDLSLPAEALLELRDGLPTIGVEPAPAFGGSVS